MKNLVSLTLITLFMFTSCSKDNEEIITNQNINSDNSSLQYRSGNKEADDEMAEVLLTKYGVETTSIGENEFSFKYPDERILNIKISGNKVTLSGTRINNETYIFDNLTQSQIDNLDYNSDYLLESNILISDFIFNVNDLSKLSPSEAALARPCNEHPSNESFKSCFKREWDEFCDGLVGCLAQATNPHLIAGVIAAHCAAC